LLKRKLKSKKAWNEVLQVMKEDRFKSRIQYLGNLSFKIEGGIKNIHDQQKLIQYITNKTALQKILKRI
jgi:uncharacterized protein YeeX (DUF496 family)